MNEQTLSDGLARKFLLGQLSPEEQGRIEALAFANADVFLFLQAAEDDLIDDFVYGELSSEEKEGFERHLLTRPGRRRDLRIARALKRHLAEEDQLSPVVPSKVIESRQKESFLQRLGLGALTGPLMAAAMIVVVLGAILLVMRAGRQDSSPRLRAQHQPSPPVPSPSTSASTTSTPTKPTPETQIKPSSTPRPPAAPLYGILLTPGAPVRSEGEYKTLDLPSRSVRFDLPVIDETSYASYQALLQKDDQTIHSWSNLHTQELRSGKGVQIDVRPGLLQKSQRYRILLNGVSSTGISRQLHSYHFQIAD